MITLKDFRLDNIPIQKQVDLLAQFMAVRLLLELKAIRKYHCENGKISKK